MTLIEKKFKEILANALQNWEQCKGKTFSHRMETGSWEVLFFTDGMYIVLAPEQFYDDNYVRIVTTEILARNSHFALNVHLLENHEYEELSKIFDQRQRDLQSVAEYGTYLKLKEKFESR